MSVTQDRIASFKENGFILLKEVFRPEDCQKTANILSEYTEEVVRLSSTGEDVTDRWYLKHRTDNGVLYDIYQRFPVVRRFCENLEIVDFLREYFRKSVYLYVSSYLYKPGDRDNVVPWHQDFLSRPRESEKVLAWISLDHSDQSNGCLEVIPGSHKSGFKEWYRVKGQTHHDRINLSEEESGKKEYIITAPGDVVLFSNYLVHSSSQNTSDKPRRVLRFVYKSLDDNSLPRGSMILIDSKIEDFYTATNIPGESSTIIGKLKRRLSTNYAK